MAFKRCIIPILILAHTNCFKCIKIDLYEHLVPLPDTIKNEKCRLQCEFYLSELKNGALWASKMFDASTKIPSGILHGASTDFGNFDECIHAKTTFNGEVISGKYCLPTIEFQQVGVSPNESLAAEDDIEIFSYINTFSTNHLKRPRNKVRVAMCIPSACDEEDLRSHLQNFLDKHNTNHKIKFEVRTSYNSCQVDEEITYDIMDYLFIMTVSFIVTAVLVSTFYELQTGLFKPQNTLETVFKSFSIISNYRKIITHYPDNNNLECIHGMRVTSTFVTVVFHILLTILQAPIRNLQEVEGWYQSSFARTILNLHSMIDIFFILTAFLTTFMLLDDLHKNKPFNYVRFYVHRLIRCSPLYVITIFFYSTIFIKLSNGPLWKEMITIEKENCIANWWVSLLYVNNYVNTDKICVIQSWFLSASMQMFFITPILVILLYRRPKIGITLLISLIILFTGINFVQVYYSTLDPIVLFTTNVIRDVGSDSFRYGYIPTHTRASAYLMGILTAYWRYKIKTKELQFPKWTLPYGWYLSTSCMAVTLYFGNVYYIRRPYSQLESAIFASGYHILVGYTMCWTIIAMSTGHGKFMETFISRQSLVPYSKITYSVNMCNFSILYYIVASLRLPIYVSRMYLIWHLVSTVVLTYAIGLVLYLFFEAPFMNLDKFIFETDSRKSPQVTEEKSK